jgi:hypothetical protein
MLLGNLGVLCALPQTSGSRSKVRRPATRLLVQTGVGVVGGKVPREHVQLVGGGHVRQLVQSLLT